jgi:UDP-glucose 4-epimerase
VYGVPDSTPVTEDAPLHPINPYGETKRAFEGALVWYARAYGLRSVTLRYFNVAGATEALGEDHDPETHLIPTILRAVESGQPVTLFGGDYPTPDGTCIRDYIHVADLADAHLRAIEATARDDERTARGAVICNLGNGGGFSNLEVLAAAERAVGRRIPHEIGPRRTGDPPVLVASAAQAQEILGWRPHLPSLDGIVGSAWAWRQAHPGGYAD